MRQDEAKAITHRQVDIEANRLRGKWRDRHHRLCERLRGGGPLWPAHTAQAQRHRRHADGERCRSDRGGETNPAELVVGVQRQRERVIGQDNGGSVLPEGPKPSQQHAGSDAICGQRHGHASEPVRVLSDPEWRPRRARRGRWRERQSAPPQSEKAPPRTSGPARCPRSTGSDGHRSAARGTSRGRRDRRAGSPHERWQRQRNDDNHGDHRGNRASRPCQEVWKRHPEQRHDCQGDGGAFDGDGEGRETVPGVRKPRTGPVASLNPNARIGTAR